MLPVKLLGDAKQPLKSMDSFKSAFGTSCTGHHSKQYIQLSF